MPNNPKPAHPAVKHSGWAQVGVNLIVLMSTLDMSIVNVSLPTLVEKLDTDFATIQWVVLSYLLVITCLMLTVSRLGDMLGKKKIFNGGIVIFTVASLLCGLSPSVEWLIAFRGMQGVGAVMSQALGVAIVAEVVEPRKLGRALGFIGGTVSVGLALGPSLGGMLIGWAGWRSIFFLNLPLGVFSWTVVRCCVPAIPPRETGQRFDIPGAVVLLVALGCYCLGMTLGQNHGFSKPSIMALLGVAAVGLALFLLVEARTRQPMLDLSLFKNILFSLNLCMGFMVFVALSTTILVPFYLQYVQGRTPEIMGLLMMVVPLAMGLVSPVAGSLADRFGPRGISILGLCCTSLGALAMTTVGIHTSWWGYILRIIPMGIGIGMFQAPNNTAIMSAVPPKRLGVASGLLNYSRTFGQTSGIPLMGTLFTALVLGQITLDARSEVTDAPPAVLLNAFTGAYRVVAMIIAATAILGIYVFWLDKRNKAAQQAASPDAPSRKMP